MFIAILLTGSFSIFPTASIDPIPDHAAGELVVITGTTNYPAGTRLVLDIFALPPSAVEQPHIGATDAFIVRGGGMKNTWSGALDTSAILPGEYRVDASWVDESGAPSFTRSGLLATALMRLTNATPGSGKSAPPLMNHTLSFIHVDHPGTIKRGDKILVTGTTNLPVDTRLLYLVIQQSGKSVFSVDPKTGKQDLKGGFTRSGLMDMQPGESGVSRWSFAIDSTEFIPDTYEVIVTQDNIRPGDIGWEGTFGTESLVVLDADADLTTQSVPDSGPCQSVSIDTLSPVMPRQKFTIHGTTSLQPGTELLFQILPAEYDLNINRDLTSIGQISGATGSVTVSRGTGDTNTWSADVDLSSFPAKEYFMNISNDRIDPRTYETIYGDRFCSKRFALSGGLP
jgi:hypothetical protein